MHGQPSSPIRGPWLRDARTADGCSAPMSSAPVWTPQIRTGARVRPGRSLRGCRGGRGLRAGRTKRRVPTSSAPPAPPACHRQHTNRGLAPVALDRWPRPAPSPWRRPRCRAVAPSITASGATGARVCAVSSPQLRGPWATTARSSRTCSLGTGISSSANRPTVPSVCAQDVAVEVTSCDTGEQRGRLAARALRVRTSGRRT